MYRTSSVRTSTAALAISTIALLLLAGPGRYAQGAPARDRANSLRQLCERLQIGQGSSVADIGCGNGADTLTFAAIVGSNGTVFAEEIAAGSLQTLVKKAAEKRLGHVVPVLGETEDPHLPNGAIQLAYMHLVFHHFAKPREMLGHLWLDLEPGGYLVVVDREKGPPRKWVDTENREKQHIWTAETTVVRLANEAGFRFHGAMEDIWNEKEPFVLVFQKPESTREPLLPPPLPGGSWAKKLPVGTSASEVLFVGLDGGRELLRMLPVAANSNCRIHDLALEEWMTSSNDMPPAITGSKNQPVRASEGKLLAPPDLRFDSIIFAHAYHRLWEPGKLLADLRGRLKPGGTLLVLETKGPADEQRRLASHRHRISPEKVREELIRAGFTFEKALKVPGPDRFLLVFVSTRA